MSVVGPAYGTGSASDADAPAPTQAHRRRHTDVWRPATSEKVQVVVRVRPALPSEQDECVWTVNGNTIACKDPDVVGVDDAADRHHFQFDRVFDQSTSTQVLYETTMKAMLGSFLDGINGTIMTYGQTCSGKTFTLSGTEASPGVNSLVVRDLLAMVAQRTEPSTVSMSYFEIYNEEVYDLLAKKGQKGDSLRVRESFDTGVFIEGLNKKAVTSVEEVEQLLQRGSQNRTTAATVWNHESSRSHTILSLELETIIHQSGPSSPDDKPSTQDDPAVTTSGSGSLGSADGAPDSGRGWRPTVPTETIRRRSILNIVDLAGSERLAKFATDKSVDSIARQKEGGNINKSLHSLTTVVSRLAQGSPHIPYRNSRLTRILQTSLGGNSRTLICVCVTVGKKNTHETISTLKFAGLAKTITNRFNVNVEADVKPKTRTSTVIFDSTQMMASQLVALQFENARAAAMLQRDEATDAMLAKSQTESERLRQERDRLNGRQVEIEQFLEAIAGQIETSVAARKPLSTGTTMVPLSIRSMVELPCNTIFEAVNSNLGHVHRLSLQNAKLLEAVSVVQQYARGLQKRIAKNDRLYSDVVVSVTEVEEAIVDDLERRGRIQDITNDLRCQMLHKELQKATATVLLLSKVVGANVVHENERIALLRSAHQSSVGRTISTAARFLRSIDWPAAFQTKEAHAAAAGDQQVVIGDLQRHLHESAAQTERIIARTIADHDAFSVSLERFQDAIGFRDAVIDVLHGRIRRQETALRHARLSCRQVQRASDTQGNVYEQQLRVLRERIERDDEQRLAMIKDADRIQTSLHDRLAAVNSDLARVTVDLNRAQADMVNAQGHRDASEVARAGLSAQLSDARRELQLSAEENERIRRQTSLEIAQLEADLATRQLALDTAQRREREVQLQRDQVVDELDTTRSRLQATGERLDEATRKVASLEASSQETESRLSREYARMKSTMEAQLEAGRRQAMTMEADLRAELSSVNAALKQEIQASMARERHDQATLQECNAARLQLGRAVQQLQMQLAEAQEKLRDCSVERDTARQDGQACQVRLQSVIDGNIIRVGELGKEIEDLKEQVRAGQKVVAELDAARDAIAAAEVQRRRDKEGWERQQQALHGQIQVVEKQRDDLEESLRMQAKKSDRLKEKLRLAQLEVQMTKEAAAKTERELRREKIRSDTMASVQLAQLRNEMSSWQEEKSDLAAEVAFSKALLGFKVAEEADKADDDGGK